MKEKDTLSLISQYFYKLGFSVIFWNHESSANGPDCYIQKGTNRPLSVEVKVVRKQTSGMFQVDPVQKQRRHDDLIAIVVNNDYVLVESMKDHIRCCSPKGTRQFTALCKS